jgi:hypothetical protein
MGSQATVSVPDPVKSTGIYFSHLRTSLLERGKQLVATPLTDNGALNAVAFKCSILKLQILHLAILKSTVQAKHK